MLRVPPVTSMSARVKLLEASLSLKLTVSVPVTTPEPVRLMAMVGGVVSGTRVL